MEELVAVFSAALTTLVEDGASPTEAHVTAVDDAWTPIAAVLGADFVMDFDRATVSTPNLIRTAVNAALQQALQVSTDAEE